MPDLKILYLQSDLIWENPEKNRSRFCEQIEENFDGHQLVVLPETFTTGFPVCPVHFAETIEGSTMQWLEQLAAKYNTVIGGSLLLNNSGNFTNTFILMHPNGSFIRYDKRHVFSMGGENKKIKAGTQHVVFELNGWKIKPMVCYDLRFPVWSKNHYENQTFEYDLAIYVANWPVMRSYPWKQLLIARAIENQAYILGVNRIGHDGQGNCYIGNSQMIDPKGKIISQAPEGKETAMSITISYVALQIFREKFNVGLDWDLFQIKT